MKRSEIKNTKITNIKSFLIVWFNGLMLGDSRYCNALAYCILGNLVVVFYAVWHIVKEVI